MFVTYSRFVFRYSRANKLTLKAPITTPADDIHKYFHCFSENIRLDVSSEFSAKQSIHMKHQALFSSKDKKEKIKCRLLQFLFGALRVNSIFFIVPYETIANIQHY